MTQNPNTPQSATTGAGDLPDVGAQGRTPLRETELGPLPEGWEVVRLDDVASMKQGRVLPINQFTNSGYPVFGANGQIGWFTEYTHANEEVLVTCRGATCGTLNISPPKSFITNNAMVVTPLGDRLIKRFLFYALKFYDVKKAITGTGQPQITKATLRTCKIPLPPLPEQRAIAQVLRTVQRAREATERVIAAARELKKSLMRHLFTYGPVPLDQVDGMRLKETEIGPLPAGWEVVRLGEVVDVKGGKRLPKGHSFSDTPTQHPYIRVVDFADGSIASSNLKFLTNDDFAVLQRYTISSEDVYISIAGTIGLVGTVPEELDGANLTENAAKLVIRNKSKILRDFLKTALSCDEQQRQISALATKTSQPKLALTRIKQLFIPLPPLPEQRAIAEMLRAVDRKIQAEERRKAALDSLFRTLLHHLMTGKVRVAGAIDVGARPRRAPTMGCGVITEPEE